VDDGLYFLLRWLLLLPPWHSIARFDACQVLNECATSNSELLNVENTQSREHPSGTLSMIMKDDESLNPDETFCQAQVDVQKMIEQLKKQADSDQENG